MTGFNMAACIILFVCFWIPAVVAQEPAPSGDLLLEIPWKCSQRELTVWGRDDDITLAPGQTDWTDVAGRHITLFCGSYETEVECPRQTDFIWVSRTGKWEVFIACYVRD